MKQRQSADEEIAEFGCPMPGFQGRTFYGIRHYSVDIMARTPLFCGSLGENGSNAVNFVVKSRLRSIPKNTTFDPTKVPVDSC